MCVWCGCGNGCRVRLKQNKYPVVMLTQGDSKRYDWYADERTWSTRMAYRVAVSENFMVSASIARIARITRSSPPLDSCVLLCAILLCGCRADYNSLCWLCMQNINECLDQFSHDCYAFGLVYICALVQKFSALVHSIKILCYVSSNPRVLVHNTSICALVQNISISSTRSKYAYSYMHSFKPRLPF